VLKQGSPSRSSHGMPLRGSPPGTGRAQTPLGHSLQPHSRCPRCGAESKITIPWRRKGFWERKTEGFQRLLQDAAPRLPQSELPHRPAHFKGEMKELFKAQEQREQTMRRAMCMHPRPVQFRRPGDTRNHDVPKGVNADSDVKDPSFVLNSAGIKGKKPKLTTEGMQHSADVALGEFPALEPSPPFRPIPPPATSTPPPRGHLGDSPRHSRVNSRLLVVEGSSNAKIAVVIHPSDPSDVPQESIAVAQDVERPETDPSNVASNVENSTSVCGKVDLGTSPALMGWDPKSTEMESSGNCRLAHFHEIVNKPGETGGMKEIVLSKPEQQGDETGGTGTLEQRDPI